MKVTVFKSFKDVENPYYIKLSSVLDGIKSGNQKVLIEKIRAESDESRIRDLKMTLPCVLFAGKFDIQVIKEREDGS